MPNKKSQADKQAVPGDAAVYENAVTSKPAVDPIPLKRPFEFEGELVGVVTWRRLKANDVLVSEQEMAADGLVNPGDGARTLYMVARATDRPVEVIKAMDLKDYLDLAAKVGDFL